MQFISERSSVFSSESEGYCVFEYVYRDASNYKAFGSILLSGTPTQMDVELLHTYLESGEYFVAEQVGIPAVYQELWELSGGPTGEDHALHEFIELRIADEEETKILPLFGELSSLLKAFQGVVNWDSSLSPNCNTEF